MDTTNIPAVTPQSGLVLQSYGPNCLVLDRVLDINNQQIAVGADLTLTLPNGTTATRRITTVSTTARPPGVADTTPTTVAFVTYFPGYSFALHAGTSWAVAGAAAVEAVEQA
jgi:hypothetical protein